MKETQFQFPSHTGTGPISASRYDPEGGEGERVLVIHHGMAEHRARYRDFIGYLCDNHIRVYMHDMASHGQSHQKGTETGWFGEKDGWLSLIEDYRELVLRAGRENPGKKIILMGHSMGSFIVRVYTAKYPGDGFAGAIYMGTGGPNPAAAAGRRTAELLGMARGKKHKSKMMNQLAFGAYGKRFEGRTPFDWLSRDKKVVDRYMADEYCGFLFTVQGMHDLVSVNLESNTENWFRSVPKELPVLLVSGEEDPVGGYGLGVRKVAEKLGETGHSRVTLKLYPGARHEVLNELNREEVMRDVTDWILSI